MLYIYKKNGPNFQTYQKLDQANRFQQSHYSCQVYEDSPKQEG